MAEKEKDKKKDIGPFPTRVVVDFMEGVTKKSEAVAFARGFIENHFSSFPACGWYISKYAGGYVFEAHEGGHGRAYLPAALEVLEQNYDASVCIMLSKRILVVKRAYTGEYTSVLLPEGMDPTGDNLVYIEPGPHLKPYQSDGSGMFFFGIFSLIISFVSFLVILVLFAMGAFILEVPSIKEKNANLPLAQWYRVERESNYKTYIHRLEFKNGRWALDKRERIKEEKPLNQQNSKSNSD